MKKISMKKMRKPMIMFMVTTMILSIFNVRGHQLKASAETKAQVYVEAMEPGWNLGNSFDAVGGETAWGNPLVSNELILAVKEQGYNSIRIPITWEGHYDAGDTKNYTITENYFKRLDTVINQALDAELYVMINMHHDSWSWINKMDTDDTVLPKFKALWMQIAEHYKDYSDKLMFESVNEPTFDDVSEDRMIELLNMLNQSFYDIVRDSGSVNAARMLVLPTVYTNDSAERCKGLYDMMTSLQDNNLIATIHYYGFWPFSVNIAGKTTFDAEVIRELEAAFDRVNQQFIENDIPVICGEYGLLGFDNNLDTVEHGEILKYFEYIGYYAKKSEVLLMLWDNGQHFNRNKFTWSDPELYEIIKTSWEGRSSYGSSDRIFINKDTRNKAQEMKLTLNGNTLKAIYKGTEELVLGTDYTYIDETVIFESEYLDSQIKDAGDAYGTATSLRMEFSSGANWKIDVIYYDVPVLSDAIGTSTVLSIPIEFKGSKLATMEATYVDGSGNAGPQNWTSFKQYAETFSPDYTNNTITINSKFFLETKNGDILLKFYFQSGEVLDYTITKADTEVKGTAIDNVKTTPVNTEPTATETPVEESNTSEAIENTEETTMEVTIPVEAAVDGEASQGTFIVYIIAIIMIVGLSVSALYIYSKMKKKD